MERVLLLLPTTTYRTRDFLAAAEQLGVEVVVGSEETSTMEPSSSDRLLTLSFLDPEGAASRVARFHEEFPLTAVVGVDEETAVIAAAVARRLGLPHNSPESAERARLKHRMREALAAGTVPSPSFRLVSRAEDPASVAASLRYPVVLKPVFLSGSRGVIRADDRESFVRAFLRLRGLLETPDVEEHGGAESRTILIEDYVPGLEVAVEGLLTRGELRLLALFDKPDPLEGPYFEETIYVTPSRLDQDVQRRILSVTSRAAEALGLSEGAVHAELRLTESGPVVVEVAGRSIGGLCSRALRFGLGISLEELILRHALGRDVTAVERESSSAGVMMIPIPRGGVLEEVRGLDQARAVEGVDDVTISAHLGKTLVPLPEGSSYLGFIFARAAKPDQVERSLRDAHRRLSFTIR